MKLTAIAIVTLSTLVLLAVEASSARPAAPKALLGKLNRRNLQSCDREIDAVDNCASETCGDCVIAAIPDSAFGCSDYESQFCSDFKPCRCGSCDDEIIDLVNCALDFNEDFSDCSVNCSAGSTLTVLAGAAAAAAGFLLM